MNLENGISRKDKESRKDDVCSPREFEKPCHVRGKIFKISGSLVGLQCSDWSSEKMLNEKKNSKYVAKDFTDRQIVVGQKGFGGEPAGYNGERNFEKQLFAFRKSDFLKFLPTHVSLA